MVRSSHHTQWAGTYAFAAELSRRSYDAAPTREHSADRPPVHLAQRAALPSRDEESRLQDLHPDRQADLPDGNPERLLPCRRPCPLTGPNRYFILTHQQIKAARERMPKTKKTGDPYKEGFDGLEWPLVEPYENAWHSLPA